MIRSVLICIMPRYNACAEPETSCFYRRILTLERRLRYSVFGQLAMKGCKKMRPLALSSLSFRT
jgi:hypothetical protein